jgi:hypothetical protein
VAELQSVVPGSVPVSLPELSSLQELSREMPSAAPSAASRRVFMIEELH